MQCHIGCDWQGEKNYPYLCSAAPPVADNLHMGVSRALTMQKGRYNLGNIFHLCFLFLHASISCQWSR
jgi:hypothetical protein